MLPEQVVPSRPRRFNTARKGFRRALYGQDAQVVHGRDRVKARQGQEWQGCHPQSISTKKKTFSF